MDKAKKIFNGNTNIENIEVKSKDKEPQWIGFENITIIEWTAFKRKFNKHFDYGGMTIHREDVLNFIEKELLKK